MRSPLAVPQKFIAELQRRSVFHVAGVYGAVSFVILQAADLLFPALMFSEETYRVLVWLVLVGFPLALVLAWFFDLTAQGVRRAASAEPALPREASGRALKRRFQILSVVVIGVFVTTAFGLGAARNRLGGPRADDGRIAVAVFPFRAIGGASTEWSEGIADLLSTTLDGTAGMRVIDPWSLWQRLRKRSDASALSPDPTQAAALGRAAGARRIVLGSTVLAGNEVRLSVRIYDPRMMRPLETFAEAGSVNDMPAIVQRLANQVITRVWDEQTMPGMPRLEPNVTQSTDALKAYLAAKAAMRQGQIDSAVAAIDRAITLDTTFALALVDAVTIRSWQFSLSGQPYAGFFELVERALQHDDSLSERLKLRVAAMQASIRTEGEAAATALQRIIEIDSTDLVAWSHLAYVRNVYGWQYGATVQEAIQAADRVVALDSSYVPGLLAQAWTRLSGGDTVQTRGFIERLERADTTAPLARSTLRALRALRSDERTFRTQAERLAESNQIDWFTALRYMRAYTPARAEMLLDRLRDHAQSGPATSAILGEQVRLRVAEARLAVGDSILRSSGSTDDALWGQVQRMMVAAALAGIGDPAVHRSAAAWLHASVPPELMLALAERRPTWWSGWLVGAYHAQLGDTVLARRYQRGLGTLPAGGSPAQYREALQSDIEARIAARRGDAQRALQEAWQAIRFWNIHSENQSESMPEPALRFHLATLLVRTGAQREAEPIFRSLVPPTTWMGFLSARSSLELGDLAAARGDGASAAHHYSFALRLWERGGAEAAVLRSQVESRLARLVRRVQG